MLHAETGTRNGHLSLTETDQDTKSAKNSPILARKREKAGRVQPEDWVVGAPGLEPGTR